VPASRMTQKAVAERRSQVLKARSAGMSYEQIARSVPGIGDAKAAAQDLRRALADGGELRALSGENDAGGALELELGRLDAAALAVEGVLRNAAADPSLHDRVLRAADRLARLSELRAHLLGLGGAQKPAGAAEDELGARRRRVASRHAMKLCPARIAWRRARCAASGIARCAVARVPRPGRRAALG
jgi:hypothetical protein